MTGFDRILQQWRLGKVAPYLTPGARVLDVGCADGALFRRYQSSLGEMVGIDPDLGETIRTDRCTLMSGHFPDSVSDAPPFDVITMLAVLEHIPAAVQRQWAAACPQLLKPGGHLVITVPSPVVDRILAPLQFLRIVDGMSLEQHYGFEPSAVPSLFAVGEMKLAKASKFQLGCNNLFVFRKAA